MRLIFELFFFAKKNTSKSARRVCYGRANGSVSQLVSESVSERCMYVTPI